MAALLSHESLPFRAKCTECQDKHAGWRCKDCNLSAPLCRSCIRHKHRLNPLHRIQKWNGKHYRNAELYEVGSYLLITHAVGERICINLDWQINLLEQMEAPADLRDQMQRGNFRQGPVDNSEAEDELHAAAEYKLYNQQQMDVDDDELRHNADHNEEQAEGLEDAAFEEMLNNQFRRLHQDAEEEDDTSDIFDPYDNEEWDGPDHAEEDVPPLPHLNNNRSDDYAHSVDGPLATPPNFNMPEDYHAHDADMPDYNAPEYHIPEDAPPTQAPRKDMFQNQYVRIMHTSGLHHLAMLACNCHGHEQTIADLVANRLIPCSFDKIRTLFTVHVLDDFCLANLETKASAYQYVQLL